jgi:hypothetical protein
MSEQGDICPALVSWPLPSITCTYGFMGGQEPRVSDTIFCVLCQAETDDWVVWGAAFVEEVSYFCSNACLAAWLGRMQTAGED